MLLGGVEINDIIADSRLAHDGAAFCCLTGANLDGHAYARSAYDKGARVFVCEHKPELPADAVILLVPDSRAAMSLLSAELYGHPARKMTMIGITGTKGKTTAAAMLYQTLTGCGKRCALCGTTGIFIGGTYKPTANTTPESVILQRAFADAVDAGVEYMIIEVSSQAYKMRRVYGVEFDIGIFTNLSRDHIGGVEHADYAEYRECKSELFAHSAVSILNADDRESPYMAKKAKGRVVEYGISGDGEKEGVLYARSIRRWYNGRAAGSSFDFCGESFNIRLPGDFNVANCAAALACCRELGINLRDAAAALENVSVKGRFETVQVFDDRVFIIDYAHNGVSLRSALALYRAYEPKRLVVLFGSVGGRTEERRADMGRAAAEYADFAVITSDNPDFEPPQSIIADIEAAVGELSHICITDRAEAIRYAVENSRPGDIVIFAGKGHEDYQLIEGEKRPFSERALIEAAASETAVRI